MNIDDIKEKLREWIADKSQREISTIKDESNLIKESIISSLDSLELIMFIESIGGKIGKIRAGVFENINTIYTTFFQE
ncbi:acyl carrier protein [Dolichospermum circinale]|uniref:Acyl carrier protein n=1 Tax=Dolichospermum circinale CS-537/01 TaxID=3021739 RepID=A0ABT5A5D0_9CYAN|nr:acyl carrier protein [Dolichospermum circinale]MDB9456223.1 acyl carrier protein [Dolichospermum circinale CS-541/06]MDB9464843.1 acyl carrier protein [Dolichospermum circinale CS-541/04]MDB9486688.1 acyl carrier protein [Dolichospermum circinale CS-537/01]MDB9547137.1 acyl carrier protein [Dolichospermum circinale CS-1031]